MRRAVFNLYSGVVGTMAAPLIAQFFLSGEAGRAYGIGLSQKLKLMRQIRRITRKITGATSYDEHLQLAEYLLKVPPTTKGVVVECGCFKGRSTATLSLVCDLMHRNLLVCDSFEGLPPIAENDRIHLTETLGRYETYEKGQYTGTQDEVAANVRKFGQIARCRFIKGYFNQTLPDLDEPIAFIFLDVDLHESLKDCLKYLWPLLQEGGYLFTHEARQLQFAKLFFDDAWWRSELGCAAPGLIGAGSGLPAGFNREPGLGYTQKLPESEQIEKSEFQRFCGDPTRSAV